MLRRLGFFLLVNAAVLVMASLIMNLIFSSGIIGNQPGDTSGLHMGQGQYLSYPTLIVMCAVWGMVGSLVSLFLSKWMAKTSVGAKVIEQPANAEESWLVDTVQRLSNQADLPMPEVAIYEGAPNAFATGATKSSALLAVSTGLMQLMTEEEVEAVLAHELAHIKNGDMVTLTLIQGVLNAFVLFFSYIVAHLLVRRSEDRSVSGREGTFLMVRIVLQLVFGVLASIIVMYFSRVREYRADSGASSILGDSQPMINALLRLNQASQVESLPKDLSCLGIANNVKISSLFASHPSIEDRVAALKKIR